MNSANLIRPILCLLLLCAGVTDVVAGTRNASVSVSATVLASCRVEAASQVASIQAASARGQCSGSTAPATRAVLETGSGPSGAQPISQAFNLASAEGGQGAPRVVRLDVLY